MAGGETGARQAERWAGACRSGGGGGGAAITAPLVSGLSMFLPHPSSLLLPDVWFFIVQCPLEFAICCRHVGVFHSICWRPYHVECTGSLLTSEVKRHRARLVLGWGTAWEDLRVLPAQLTRQEVGQRGKQEEKGEREGGGEGGGEREGGGEGEGEWEGEGDEAEEEAEAIWPLASSSASPLKLP